MSDHAIELALAVLAGVAAFIILGVLGYLDLMKLKGRITAPSTGELCIACNSNQVTLLAPMVYRCNACGHEGGDGIAAREEARRAAAVQRHDVALRRKSARRNLREARTLVSSALGTLEREMSFVVPGTDDSATLLLVEAKRKVQDAELELGVSLGVAATAEVEGIDLETYLVEATFDDDRKTHRRVAHAFAQGKVMLAAIELALRRHYPRRGRRSTGRTAAPRRARPSASG
jgi:hypothetical protein